MCHIVSRILSAAGLARSAGILVWAVWTSITFDLPVAVAHDEVDLLLVLAADVSYSVSESEFKLERQGHAKAIASPPVISAIRSGLLKRGRR